MSSEGVHGHSDSTHPSISADGRFVVFSSTSSNLVEDDTNVKRDIFVHDLETGVTERVSVSSEGIQASEHSWTSSLSADGRFVAFDSRADNLVDGDIKLDDGGDDDIFVHDRETGVTERVSISS